MADFYEIDFLAIGEDKSGDAITARYELNGYQYIHVTDGGYQLNGQDLVDHIDTYYGNPGHIDHVVATHPDGDHLGGLRTVLESYTIGALWMLRPWQYAAVLLPHFRNFNSEAALVGRLKTAFPNIAALEEIANERGIPIGEPFQGQAIGAFRVMAPSGQRYIECILDSAKTPERVTPTTTTVAAGLFELAKTLGKTIKNFVTAAWGEENFSTEPTSRENEMSVIQYANLCGDSIMLTADAGREALAEMVNFAPTAGLQLPGVMKFQVPHHGSRRNLSTDLVDQILGAKLATPRLQGPWIGTAIISAASKDDDHPKKATLRAMHHRGFKVIQTKGDNKVIWHNAPTRHGWSAVENVAYPTDQEE